MPKNLTAADVDPTQVATGQYRWDPLEYVDILGVDDATARKLALKERTDWMNQMRLVHPDMSMKAWTLTGQLRKYSSFGNPDGRVRNVYYVTVRRAETLAHALRIN